MLCTCGAAPTWYPASAAQAWEESDPRYIANSDEVKLRSFTTKVHRVDACVSYAPACRPFPPLHPTPPPAPRARPRTAPGPLNRPCRHPFPHAPRQPCRSYKADA